MEFKIDLFTMKINIIDYFKESVRKFSNRTAVIEGEKNISFSDLNLAARKLAFFILNKTDYLNVPIAVYLPKSIEAIVADIAITWSGNVYMNLDIKTPSERIKSILTTIEPVIIITNNQYLKAITSVLP